MTDFNWPEIDYLKLNQNTEVIKANYTSANQTLDALLQATASIIVEFPEDVIIRALKTRGYVQNRNDADQTISLDDLVPVIISTSPLQVNQYGTMVSGSYAQDQLIIPYTVNRLIKRIDFQLNVDGNLFNNVVMSVGDTLILDVEIIIEKYNPSLT